MTWLVTSNHLESLHDGRVITPGDEVTGVDPELDKEIIERGVVVFVGDEPKANATDAALILIEEHGLKLADIEGTGKDGRVTEPDVRKAFDEQATANGGDSPASEKDGGHEVAPETAAAPQEKEESK